MSNKPQAWQRKEDEPNLWFQRFEFFLRQGPDRSLLGTVKAWESTKANNDQKPRKVQKRQTRIYVPGSWRDAAEKWNWIERAAAYDRFQSDRLNNAQEDAAQKAIKILKENAEKAAKTIVRGLEDPEIRSGEDKTIIIPAIMKYQQDAAEAILDRVGVPRATRQEIDLGNQKVKGYVEISPDDWDDDEDTDEA